jgi:hypothetical protein
MWVKVARLLSLTGANGNNTDDNVELRRVRRHAC